MIVSLSHPQNETNVDAVQISGSFRFTLSLIWRRDCMQSASSRYLVLRILQFGTKRNFSKKPNAISLFAAKIVSLIKNVSHPGVSFVFIISCIVQGVHLVFFLLDIAACLPGNLTSLGLLTRKDCQISIYPPKLIGH